MSRSTPYIGMVAGEASGDLLGAHLIAALRERIAPARFVGVGGPRMEAAGMHVLYPMEKLAVRGYVEVLRHYLEITGIRRKLAVRFLAEPPDVFIGIDAPDFNLDLEARLRAHGIPTVQYVSPAIWAWRRERMRKIRRAVSKVLTLFPFEQALYDEAGIASAYVGHPLADVLAGFPDRRAMREQLRLPAAARVIALLPGSRVSELVQMADLFIATARRIGDTAPDALFLVPLATRETKEMFEAALYRNEAQYQAFTLMFGHAHEAIAAADVVLAASGTATLEAALLRRPMVITYRMPRLSWWITCRKKYLPYVGLPNILAGRFIVPEILQDDATPENLAQALLNLLNDTRVRARLESRLAELGAALRQDAARKAVEAILPLLQQ